MASVTDAEKALCSTNGKENFQRLTRLLMCGGVRLLRETFDSIHPPKDLPLKLGDPATRSQLKKAKLSRAEWSCLYPQTGTFGKSIEFDITLTFRLLRTICNLTPPVTGWDSLPSSADRSFEADLARIKLYRNSIYGHNHKMEVSDSDFWNLWKEISEALLRIANYHGPGKTDEWKKSIGKLLTDPLTSEAQSFVEELELWYKKDMEVKDQLQDQFQEVNEKLDLLITFKLESFSRRGQPLAHLYSGPRSAGMTSLSIPEQQPQFAFAEATSGENQGGDQNPSEEPDIWKVVLSFKESFRLLLDYLSSQLKLRILSYGSGSLSITAACSSLEILEGLWKDYCSGHLNTVAEKILFTSEVLKRLSLSEVKLRTIIKEEDYHKLKQCLVDEDQLKKADSCVHLSLRSDATNKSSVNVHYILIENITLIKGQDYRTSKLLTGEELERGTILQQDPRDKTRFVLADRQEVFFYESCVEGLDDKLKRLSDALAKMLLEIASLGERLQLFNRLVGRESSRRDTYSEAELLRPRTPTEGADGRPRSRRSESTSVARRDEERQKLENELTLRREQIHTLTARKEDLEKQLYEKECRSVRQDEERKKLEKELELQKGRTNTLVEKNEALKKQLSEKDTHLAAFDQQRRKLEEEKVQLMKELKVLQEKLNEVTQSRSEQKDPLTRRLNDLQENLDKVRESGNEERYQLMERLKDLQEDLDEVTRAREVAEQQVGNLEAESKAKDKHMKELEESLSTVQQALDGRPKESCEWVISRDEIFVTDKILGEAAWGKVLLGRFRNCKVAVKQVHSLIRCPSARSSFEREMEIASRCRHPCLLQFIGATNDEGTPLLVTELMETSLRAFLEAQFQTLSYLGISIISLDVALALNYLHKTEPLPIIHRDVSSVNVLLWRQGPHWRGKVSAANFTQQTMTIAPGTMVYSAPEALTPNDTVKIDVYSFGVLLCEMCTGKFPDPDQREEHISQVTNQEFKSLIQRCVQPNPKKRPDMKEICAEVEALYDHQSESEGDTLLIRTIEQILRGAARETNDGEQLREVHHEAIEPHTASSVQPSQESCDWTIRRDQIELTDECRGRGYVGKVFEGKYNGCAVAVKLVHEVLLSPEYRRLFEQEINIASRCRHPCLLQFIGATNDEEFPLIVTELMETSLQSLLTSRSLSEAEVCAISQDVAEALNYLHHREPSPILHRDVCSSNVLLWRQGHQWRGKLTVSIATTFQQEIMTTAPGNMLYSAPETKGTKQTVKVDIYSFGVLLCEMCIGEQPDPEQQGQQVARVKNHVLQELIHKCLPEDPEKRPGIEYVVTELRHGKLH